MPGEARQGQLQHHFSRTLGPTESALCVLQSPEMTAYVDQDPGQLRSNRLQGTVHALLGSDDVVLQFHACPGCRVALAPARRCRVPTRGHPWRHLSKPEIRAQAFSSLELRVREHGVPILV